MRIRLLIALLPMLAFAAPALADAAEDGALARHVLNRMAFGPRPGDLDRVLKQGVDAWIKEQLRPAGIDVAALDREMNPVSYTHLTLPTILLV